MLTRAIGADTSYLESQYQTLQAYLSSNCAGVGARLGSIPGAAEDWCFDMLTLGSTLSTSIVLAKITLGGQEPYFLNFAKAEVDGFIATAGC